MTDLVLRRDVITATGRDTVAFLQGQLAQDVAGMAEGATSWSLHLTPQGRLIALVRLTRTGPDTVVIDTDAGAGEAVRANLQRFKIRTQCELELRERVRTVHRGDRSAAGLPAFPTAGGRDELDAAGDGPDSSAAEVAAWRVEHLVPAAGAEIAEQWLPPETGLLGIAVAFGKGCYVGQELVERIDARGRVNRMLCALIIDGATTARVGAGTDGATTVDGAAVPGRAEPGATVVRADTGAAVGTLTTVGGPGALGYLRVDALGAPLRIESGSAVVVRSRADEAIGAR